MTRLAKITFLLFSAILTTALMSSCTAKPKTGDSYIVRIVTSKGTMEVELFNDTPLHRDNFVKLVEDGTYNGLAFHRVIKEFMIQGGDPDTKNMEPGKVYGGGDLGYTVPAEFVPTHFHRKGALAAARQGDQVNPEKRSSASQFYIVQGKVYDEPTLMPMLQQTAAQQRSAQAVAVVRKYYQENLQGKTDRNEEALRATLDSVYDRALDSIPTPPVNPEAVKIYTTEGGVPHLDGEYTVFGQVINGMEVIDAIAACETDQYDNPKDKVEIVEMTIVRTPKGK